MNNLNLSVRTYKNGNSGRNERKKGLIPGVIYGKTRENILFEISELELNKELASTGEHGIFDYSINGTRGSGLLKDLQRDPVTHRVIHLDLEEVSRQDSIEANVPIVFLGEEYLNSKGQVLQKEKDIVKVSCSANSLPKYVKFDVGKGTAGTVYRFADIEIGSEVSIIDDLNMVLASISNEKKIISEVMEEKVEEKKK